MICIANNYRKNAYAPYSSFKVGACVYTENGEYYGGCNIENASFGATICAEQVAVIGAISRSLTKILAIAIVADKDYTFPCGICRQVLCEFSDENLEIYIASKSTYKKYTLRDLLPHSFGPESLGENNV